MHQLGAMRPERVIELHGEHAQVAQARVLEGRSGPPRQPALVDRALVPREVAVVEDEELDRGLAEAEQAEALEVVVELEAAAERGDEHQDRDECEPHRQRAMRQRAADPARVSHSSVAARSTRPRLSQRRGARWISRRRSSDSPALVSAARWRIARCRCGLALVAVLMLVPRAPRRLPARRPLPALPPWGFLASRRARASSSTTATSRGTRARSTRAGFRGVRGRPSGLPTRAACATWSVLAVQLDHRRSWLASPPADAPPQPRLGRGAARGRRGAVRPRDPSARPGSTAALRRCSPPPDDAHAPAGGGDRRHPEASLDRNVRRRALSLAVLREVARERGPRAAPALELESRVPRRWRSGGGAETARRQRGLSPGLRALPRAGNGRHAPARAPPPTPSCSRSGRRRSRTSWGLRLGALGLLREPLADPAGVRARRARSAFPSWSWAERGRRAPSDHGRGAGQRSWPSRCAWTGVAATIAARGRPPSRRSVAAIAWRASSASSARRFRCCPSPPSARRIACCSSSDLLGWRLLGAGRRRRSRRFIVFLALGRGCRLGVHLLLARAAALCW